MTNRIDHRLCLHPSTPAARKACREARAAVLRIRCDQCDQLHEATPAHISDTQGQIYEVICTDGLSDYYTAERLES